MPTPDKRGHVTSGDKGDAGTTRSQPTTAKYHTGKTLRAAVLAQARNEWRAAAGRDITTADAGEFHDRELTEDEALARDVATQLATALTAAAAFARKYAPMPGVESIPIQPATRGLLQILKFHLPSVIEGPFRVSDGAPAIASILEPTPEGWELKSLRGRVVALLGDSVRYWENFGLRGPADTRLMACATLILGEFPGIHPAEYRQGVTVAAAIQKEIHCIRAARQEVVRRKPVRTGD